MPSGETASAEPTSIPPTQLNGPWLATPLELGDPQIAVISDACAAAARTSLGEAEANLPTALVDARGENVATAILAGDELAIECRARIDSAGGFTVDLVVRLAPAPAPANGERIGPTTIVTIPDREGDRMVAVGRVGSTASEVKISFDDGSEVVASTGNGWFAAWWPGRARPRQIVASDGAIDDPPHDASMAPP